MTTTHTRTKFITAAVGAAIVGAAAPALLFLGAGTAQAVQDISERGTVAIIDHLPTPRTCPSCGGFNPQPDPPGYPDPGIRPPLILDPGSSVGVIDPGNAAKYGDEENFGEEENFGDEEDFGDEVNFGDAEN